MDFIEIEIINWSKFNPRSTIVTPRWFAMTNRLFEDTKMHDFSHGEIVCWIYILSYASQANSSVVSLSFSHAAKFGSIKRQLLVDTINKLEKLQCIQLRDHDLHTRVPNLVTTGQDKTRQDITGGVSKQDATSSLPELCLLWNKHCGEKLAKVVKTNRDRNKKIKTIFANNSPEDWAGIILRISGSDFCCGGGPRGWRADFDWLLQPGVYLKVLEGRYDNNSPGGVEGFKTMVQIMAEKESQNGSV